MSLPLSTTDHTFLGRDELTQSLLAQATDAADPVEAQRFREEAVLTNRSLAFALARQYRGRGVEDEDLEQVAMLGLVNAVRRFRPDAGKGFAAFAVPTIMGELKRYFRDHGWSVRPPRSVQELNQAIRLAAPELAQALHREPTTQELADELGCSTREVEQAELAQSQYHARSLDAPVRDTTMQLGETLADSHDPYSLVDACVALRPAFETLGKRERWILRLRFVDDLTQEQIGQRVGVSQMQVSRLLASTLKRLREQLEDNVVSSERFAGRQERVRRAAVELPKAG